MKRVALGIRGLPRVGFLFLFCLLGASCSAPEGVEVGLYSGSRAIIQDATIMQLTEDRNSRDVAQITASILSLSQGQSDQDVADEIFAAYLGTFAEVSGLGEAWLYFDTLPAFGPIRVSSGVIYKYERRASGIWFKAASEEAVEIKTPPGPKHPTTEIVLPSGHSINLESMRVEIVGGVLSIVLDYHADFDVQNPDEVYDLSVEVWEHYLKQEADEAFVDRALIFAFDRPKYGPLTFRGHLFIFNNRKADGDWWEFPPTLDEVL